MPANLLVAGMARSYGSSVQGARTGALALGADEFGDRYPGVQGLGPDGAEDVVNR